jgi:Peptidase family M23/Fibronectin type III domain
MSSDPLTPAAPRPALLLVLAAVVLTLLGQPAAAMPLSTTDRAAVPLAALATSAPTEAHPFSDPLWLPLRNPARVSCAMSNCTKGTYHGYWAVDFVGTKGDPVYAAGAGVLHVGDIDPGCKASATDIEAGTWVWVDHGGGRITKYNHLDSIVAKEGQRVTPATVIGRMGHSGDVVPCSTNYLHFEVRSGGVTGVRVNPGSLLACTSQGRIRVLDALGVTSWNEPSLPGRKVSTPATTSTCINDTWDATPARPSVSVGSRPRSSLVSWSAPPAGANQVVILQELWSPSLLRYGWPTYVVTSATSRSRTFVGLTDGRTYRYSVAFHNTYGNGAWSAPVTTIPASVPSTPEAPRFLTSPTRDYIHYGWWKSADNGSAVTSYRAARRCMRNGVYGDWVYVDVPGSVYYTNFRGLTGLTTCQTKVRAANRVGHSGWSKVSTITKQA